MKTIPFTAAHTYIGHIWQYPLSPAVEKSFDNKSVREQNVRIAYMESLRQRCLFFETCKWNPSKGVWHPSERGTLCGRTTPPPLPPPALALTKRNAAHLLRTSRRTCVAHCSSCGMFCLPCRLHCSAVLLLAFLLFQQTVVGLQFLRLKDFYRAVAKFF